MKKIIVSDGVTEVTFLSDYRNPKLLIVASRPLDSTETRWTTLSKLSLCDFLCANFKMFEYEK